jgi:hypothetical protein
MEPHQTTHPQVPDKVTQNLEQQLMITLKESTIANILTQYNETLQITLAEMSVGINMEAALHALKIFQLRKSLGDKDLLKLICFIVKSYADSMKSREKLSSAEIIETADLIISKYTHDSFQDIVLAFKKAKLKNKVVYGNLTINDIFEVINSHFQEKVVFLENRNRDFKNQEATDEKGIYKQMPQKIKDIYSRMMPKDHPNKEALRLKLTINKNRKKRYTPIFMFKVVKIKMQ